MDAASPREPEIAVVIPTRDRESRLAFALEALAEQTLDRDRYEVIVVRGGDVRGPRAEAPEGLAVRFLSRPDSGGAAVQRNEGWRAASAPLVAFTDDDCRPARDWLERLLAAADGDATFVQGRTEPDPDERHLLYGLARTIEITEPGPWYETCNIAYPRALLERLGGFDERFPGVWGEDTDLGVRARAVGARRTWRDDAVVWHAVLPRRFRAALRETARYDAIPLVLSLHPELIEEAFPNRLIKTTHATLLGALVGAIAFRRRPGLAALAAVPYLREHLARHLETNPLTPRSLLRLAVHLPAPVACDVAELAITIRSAIRNRVAVL